MRIGLDSLLTLGSVSSYYNPSSKAGRLYLMACTFCLCFSSSSGAKFGLFLFPIGLILISVEAIKVGITVGSTLGITVGTALGTTVGTTLDITFGVSGALLRTA